MTRKLIAAVACVLVAACASGDGSDTTATDTPAETTTADTAAPDTTTTPTTEAPQTTSEEQASDGGAAGTITMANISYSGTSTIGVGETLELVNQDEVPHTFTAEDESFDVSIPSGGTANFTFEEPGEYAYFCTIHPSMTGTITVEG